LKLIGSLAKSIESWQEGRKEFWGGLAMGFEN